MARFYIFALTLFTPLIVMVRGAILPETGMTVPEIIDYFGYPSETIFTTTADGYILVMHRIPWGQKGCLKHPRPVVFLQHGLLGSSADWTTNVPSQSAAYVFADAGYDVWMGNVRGNVYSCDHVKYSKFSTKYWNFSFDEMASIDLPTMINTVINITGQEKVYYVGHSQGTLIMFAQGSKVNSSLASKVQAFFALAPVNTVAYTKGLMSYISRHIGGFLSEALKLFGSTDFMPSNAISKMIAYLICGYRSAMCDNLLFQIAGPNSHDINQTRIIVYVTHEPAGTSTKNIMHWIQMTRSGKFCKYDYESENQKHYGQPNPPDYDISTLTIPTYLYYSFDDWLADPTDVEANLIPKLRNSTLKEVNHLGVYNHLDYIWGMHAVDKIYNPIISRIKKLEQMKSNRSL